LIDRRAVNQMVAKPWLTLEAVARRCALGKGAEGHIFQVRPTPSILPIEVTQPDKTTCK